MHSCPRHKGSQACRAATCRRAKVRFAPRAPCLLEVTSSPIGTLPRHFRVATWPERGILLLLSATGKLLRIPLPTRGELPVYRAAIAAFPYIPSPPQASDAARNSSHPWPDAHGENRDTQQAKYQSTVSTTGRWRGRGSRAGRDHWDVHSAPPADWLWRRPV